MLDRGERLEWFTSPEIWAEAVASVLGFYLFIVHMFTAEKPFIPPKLFKDVADDCSYLIISEWSDDKAFQAFLQSQAFRDVTNWGKEQILSDRPRHKIYKH